MALYSLDTPPLGPDNPCPSRATARTNAPSRGMSALGEHACSQLGCARAALFSRVDCKYKGGGGSLGARGRPQVDVGRLFQLQIDVGSLFPLQVGVGVGLGLAVRWCYRRAITSRVAQLHGLE